MPGDFSISPTPPRLAIALPASGATPPVSPAAQPDPAAVAAASKRPLVNPNLHLDLALNLVVLQFFDDKGEVINSFPSARQLKAYRIHQTDPAPVKTVHGS